MLEAVSERLTRKGVKLRAGVGRPAHLPRRSPTRPVRRGRSVIPEVVAAPSDSCEKLTPEGPPDLHSKEFLLRDEVQITWPQQQSLPRPIPDDEDVVARLYGPAQPRIATQILRIGIVLNEAGKREVPLVASKVRRSVLNSSRRLFALSEKMPPPVPAGWSAWPKRGDVMFPMIGPGLL